jgi:hypothetical protein
MKRYLTTAVLAVALTTGLAGCSNKERDELRTKVTVLDAEAVKAKADLSAKDATIADLRAQVDAASAATKAAQDKAAAAEAENAKLKEAAAAKSKPAAPAKKKK